MKFEALSSAGAGARGGSSSATLTVWPPSHVEEPRMGRPSERSTVPTIKSATISYEPRHGRVIFHLEDGRELGVRVWLNSDAEVHLDGPDGESVATYRVDRAGKWAPTKESLLETLEALSAPPIGRAKAPAPGQ